MKCKKFFHSRVFSAIIGIVAFLQPFLFYLYRDFHYFIDNMIFSGFHCVLSTLMIAAGLYVIGYIYFTNSVGVSGKAARTIYIISFVLISVFAVLNLAMLIGLNSAVQMFRSALSDELIYIISCAVAVMFLFAGGTANPKKAIAVLAAFVVFITACTAGIDFYKLSAFEFTAEPSVFDTGSDYSIVWATSDNSVGSVEYKIGGETVKIYDEVAGRITSDKNIHSVRVPYEALQNNSYTVSSKRVKTNVAYTPKTGRTISFTADFKGTFSDDITVTVITDNHNCRQSFFDSIAEEKSDAVFMMGDFADMISDDETITDNLLYPAAKISKGEVPVVYSKGNHDERGAACNDILGILGFDNFYYTAYLGDYRLNVLDSGECDEDDFTEYGGLADFMKYRDEELEWLGNLKAEKSKYDIVLCHNPIFSPAKEQSEKYNEILGKIGTDLCISGHLHELFFDADGYETVKYPVAVCGGIIGDYFKTGLRYTVIKLSGDNAEITGMTIKGKNLTTDYTDSVTMSKTK